MFEKCMKKQLRTMRRSHVLITVKSFTINSCIQFFVMNLILQLISRGIVSTAAATGTTNSLNGVKAENLTTWDHAVDLNNDFRILWTINNQDITFEIQARSLGYVGFGFSPNGEIAGSDVAIGWVQKGHTYFQDRHVPHTGILEALVDPSQDYILILGYENTTHTVLRFRRKLETCDSIHDIAITNDTMRLMFIYSNVDPPNTSILPDSLKAFRPYRPMILTQRPITKLKRDEQLKVLELRNEDVELPSETTALFWCKMFKLDDINHKHHLIRYEPIYDTSMSVQYLQQITLHECQGYHVEFEEMSREQGHQCIDARDKPLACNTIVASWARGAEGFTYPDEAGYPFESQQARYYLLETHYSNLKPSFSHFYERQMADNSGLRIYLTNKLRSNDAGVLSIGMDPNWRHIIPPGQKQVVSEGTCIEDCTGFAFPQQGINIFAVMMRTHQIGKEIKLRQIRHTEEFTPIAQDNNVDNAYQEFRRLPAAIQSMPGDRLIAECIYDSTVRKAITLGGLTMKEESCIILTMYYPRQKKLTVCHSLPSLPTVLHSLGIVHLATDSNPVRIVEPIELAGMTLETRLISFDWENQFNEFQDATKRGSFKPLCWGAKNHVIPGSEILEGYTINVTKTYKKPRLCKQKRFYVTEDLPLLHEMGNNHIIEGAARSSRSSAVESSLTTNSGTLNKLLFSYYYLVFICYFLLY